MQTDRRLSTFQVLLVLALLAAACLRIGSVVAQLDHLQMDMDEATHAMHGLEFVAAFQAGDFEKVRGEILKPHWYPPGYGLGLAAWFELTTADLRSARLYSLVHFAFFGLLLWWGSGLVLGLARDTAGDPGTSTYWVRWVPLLFLLADVEHWAYSAMAMLELPVVLTSMAALFGFLLARKRRSVSLYIAVFLLASVCFFIKYSSGILLLATLGLTHVAWTQNERPRETGRLQYQWRELRPLLPGILVAAVILATWLFGLGQFRWFWTYAQAQPSETALLSWDNLSFYPRFLLTDPIRALALIGALLALPFLLRSGRQRSALLFVIYVLLGLVMTTITTQNSARFFVPFLPGLWMLVLLGLAQLSNAQPTRGRIVAASVCASLVLGLGWNYVTFGKQMPYWYENTNDGVDRAYRYVSENLDIVDPLPVHIALLGRSDQWNARSLAFVLKSEAIKDGDPAYASRLKVEDERDMERGWPRMRFSRKERAERRGRALEEADLLVTLSTTPDDPTKWRMGATATFLCQGTKYPDTQLEVRLHRPSASSASR